jgi:ferritin-like metal-binding protein YciE
LSDLVDDTLKDVISQKTRFSRPLPKMAKAAQPKDLKAALVKHERGTLGRIKRLQGIF